MDMPWQGRWGKRGSKWEKQGTQVKVGRPADEYSVAAPVSAAVKESMSIIPPWKRNMPQFELAIFIGCFGQALQEVYEWYLPFLVSDDFKKMLTWARDNIPTLFKGEWVTAYLRWLDDPKNTQVFTSIIWGEIVDEAIPDFFRLIEGEKISWEEVRRLSDMHVYGRQRVGIGSRIRD